jgi:hypothetical protein
VQLGDRDTSGCKLGILNTHTQNQRREKVWHVSAPYWATSACQCHVSALHWSTSPMWVPHIWQVGPTYATWQSATSPHRQPLHQTETSGSAWLSHVNKDEPCGIYLLVHINSRLTIWDTTNGHVAACHGATSATECHMALPYWSTSPLWAPLYHKMTDKWAPLGATWQAQIGAMSLHSVHKCYIWLHLIGTSQHKEIHMAPLGRATSLITNRSLVLRVCLLSNQPIRPCHLSTLTQING